MSIVDIIFIGVALAMDAFALTISNCAVYKNSLDRKKEWSMPVAFALFQFLMPVIGALIGSIFSSWLSTFSKYLTAGIFFILAFKILYDNIKEYLEEKNEKAKNEAPPSSEFNYKILLLQAIATSIDALAVGVTFAVELSFSVYLASLIIGIVTFIIVSVALVFGKLLGKAFGKYAEYFGAFILLILAIKNLF